MGYTNYYNQSADFTDKEWNQIKDEFEYIKEIAGDSIVIQSNGENWIQFNGNPGCESFYISKMQKLKEIMKIKILHFISVKQENYHMIYMYGIC